MRNLPTTRLISPLHAVLPARIARRALLQLLTASALSIAPPSSAASADEEPQKVPAEAAAPESETATPWPSGSIGRQIRDDMWHLFTRPARLRGREWILPAALAGATAGLYVVRDEIRDEVQSRRSEEGDEFLQDVRLAGKGAFVPALAAVLALVGSVSDSPREKQTSLLLMESFAGSAFYAALGSTILAAERPEEGDSVLFFDTDGHGVSLDTALAASMIAPLERAYFRPRPGESKAGRIWRGTGRALLYLVPALVALQRINQDQHWAPDVFLGYATGYLVGRTLTRRYDPPLPTPPPESPPAAPPNHTRGGKGTLPGN